MDTSKVMEWVVRLFRMIGSIVCHQIPERTLELNGVLLPVCARDAGVYLGIFSSVVFILVTGRLRANRPPDVKQAVVLLLMMLPVIADGMTSYMGLRETTNFIRLFTGVLFGVSLPIFLVPAAWYSAEGHNHKRVLKGWKELLIVTACAAMLAWVALVEGVFPWLVPSSIVVASMIFVLGRLAFTLAVRLRYRKKWIMPVVASGITVGMAVFLYVVSHCMIRPFLLKG